VMSSICGLKSGCFIGSVLSMGDGVLKGEVVSIWGVGA